MESSHSSSSSSSSSSSASTPPRCRKRKRNTNCVNDIVAALHQALLQSSDCEVLKHLRSLVSFLQSPDASSPALTLCANSLVEILPPLLSHSCSKVGKKSAEAVGLLAIASYEISCRLAENQEVLGSLAQLLQRANSDALLSVAIRSILNVATSDVGCAALREVTGLLQQLLWLVSFLAHTLTEMVKAGDTETFGMSHKDVGTGGYCTKEFALSDVNAGVGHQKRDLDFLLNLPLDEIAELFDLALAAVNTIIQDFGPVRLITRPDVLIRLQSLWQTTIHLKSQFDEVLLDVAAAESLQSPIRRAQLAKLIMRLAMRVSVEVKDKQSRTARSDTVIGQNPLQTKSDTGDLRFSKGTVENVSCDSGLYPSFSTAVSLVAMKVKGERYGDASTGNARMLFGNVDHFFQKHWELSPARMTTVFGLSSFLERFAGSGPARMLELLVDAMVACPPTVADELDPSVLFKDMEQELGLLPVLNQDIRLLKCESGVEIPYPFKTSKVSSRDCIRAYASGNTVVIRGLQFRWPEIAAICNGLAAELGQVTVGANLYLTPPGSQGLGVHFDDHCVFVCQLRGCKRWSVYPPLELLPRLYSFKKLSIETKKECATHFNLQEKDLLYIPRGFLHEARTVSPEDVEVPAEGCAADNLAPCHECCYNEPRTSFTDLYHSGSSTPEWHGASLHLSFGVEVEPAFEWEGLLHIALRLWSHRSFQQHATKSSPNNLYETVLHVAIRNVGSSSQLFRKACVLSNTCTERTPITDDAENFFRFMLEEVRESADYLRAVECCREEGVVWLDWLRHLPEGGLIADLGVSTEVAESAFVTIRNRFCQEASFLESVAAQEALLWKFRSCRQKVMNGLLALHGGGNSGHQDGDMVLGLVRTKNEGSALMP